MDDFSRTGTPFKEAKNILKGARIKTFVINGKADYNLYSYKTCLELKKFKYN